MTMRRTGNVIAIVALGVFFGYVTWLGYRRISRGEFSDFAPFYRASQALASGNDPYARVPRRPYIYPPLLAFFYLPLSALSEKKAASIILPINVACIVAALAILARTYARRLRGQRAIELFPISCLLALIPVADKIKSEVRMFQSNALMLLCFSCALATLESYPIAAGLLLGIAFNIKYLSVVFVPYLILRRRWTVLGAFVVGAVGFALLPAVGSGWDRNLVNLASAWRGLLGLQSQGGLEATVDHGAQIQGVTVGFSTSITSALARSIRAGGATALLAMCAAVASAILVIWRVVAGYRRARVPLLNWRGDALSSRSAGAVRSIEFAGIIVLALCFSPQTNMRHLVLGLIPSALAATVLIDARTRTARMLAAAGLLLILFGFSFPPRIGDSGRWLDLSAQWIRAGGPCIALLAAYCLLLTGSLREAGGFDLPNTMGKQEDRSTRLAARLNV